MNVRGADLRYESEGIRLSYLSSRVFGVIAGIEDTEPAELLARSHVGYAFRILRKRGLIDDNDQITERGERFAERLRLPLVFPVEQQTIVFGFSDPRLPRRFWSKAVPEPTSGCWLWTATTTERGYAAFGVNGIVERAHRVAYLMLRGPVPDGLELDHKCRVTSCVNPAHLEAVTHAVNVQRFWDSSDGYERRRRERTW